MLELYMIVIDILLLIHTPILSLTYLKFLLSKKRKIHFYFLYGLLLDFILQNYLFFNTLFMFFIYALLHKRKHYGILLFLIVCLLLQLMNCIFWLNFKYMFSWYFCTSFLTNMLYYILCDNIKV